MVNKEQALTTVPSSEVIALPDLALRAERVRTLLAGIDQRNRQNIADAVHIGEELQHAKKALAHGQFGEWLQVEFSMSRSSATRYMQLARVFADKLSTLDNLSSLSAAFLLAQVSTPDTVREAVLRGELPDDLVAIREAIAAVDSSLDEEDEEDEEQHMKRILALVNPREEDIDPMKRETYQAILRQAPHMSEFHRLTSIIPSMTVEEYAGLVESIAMVGLIHPIKTFRGKIIDGRMRYLACRDAGILPQFEEWNGEEEGIFQYILSMNVYRDHYTQDQQAMTLVLLEEYEKREALKVAQEE